MLTTGTSDEPAMDQWSRLPEPLAAGADFLPARLDLFVYPSHAPEPAAWIQHVPFIRWLFDELEPKTFVELGTEHGLSYFAVCDAVRQLGLPTVCYAVDHWQGDAHTGSYGENVYKTVEGLNVEFAKFSTLVRETFDDAAPHFSESSIDVLHIDGHHTYEAARADYDNWIGKVSPGGVVLLHDTNVRKLDFGVFRLMEELRQEWPCLEFPFGNGLGVVCKGQSKQSKLFDLATGPEEVRRRFIALMGWLGASMQNSYDARKMYATVGELKTARELADQFALDAQTARIALSALDDIIENKRVQVEVLEERLQISLAELEIRRRIIEDLQSSVSWRVTQPLRLAKRVAVRPVNDE